jgi:hypothetical protein
MELFIATIPFPRQRAMDRRFFGNICIEQLPQFADGKLHHQRERAIAIERNKCGLFTIAIPLG